MLVRANKELPRTWYGNDSDIVANGPCYKIERSHGDTIYTIDTQRTAMYDEVTGEWVDQDTGMVV